LIYGGPCGSDQVWPDKRYKAKVFVKVRKLQKWGLNYFYARVEVLALCVLGQQNMAARAAKQAIQKLYEDAKEKELWTATMLATVPRLDSQLQR
jgi:hypothetical protein